MKKMLSVIICISLCIMFVIPVSASEAKPKENVVELEEINVLTYATSYFSKTLRLSSTKGVASPVMTFSSGSISGSAQITSISLYVRASSGSDPFIIYIQAPDGTMYSFVITGSGTIIIDNFNGLDPSDTWKMWIETQGTMSIANITLKVNYSY